MRPRCSVLTGGFDFSGCGDFTSCPPVERAAMSNSEPSAIVLHGIPCIGGLYISRFPGTAMIGAKDQRRRTEPALSATEGSVRPTRAADRLVRVRHRGIGLAWRGLRGGSGAR